MKQLIVIAAILTTLFASTTSCSKDNAIMVDRPQVDTFYSRIRIFTDGRQPGRDTLTTIKILSRDQYDVYNLQAGKIIEETSTYFIVGVIWMKEN